MLVELERGVKAGLDGTLLGIFTAFARRLRAHLRFEEEALFPQIEKTFPDRRGAAESLRREHGPMRELLTDIERGLSRPDHRGVLANLGELERTIELHYSKTQRDLSPCLDELAAANPSLALWPKQPSNH